ncbi:hypothetical protein HWV54_02870 [Bartonella alsatica]|uniref:Uncharacterized protein n=2 Tax=Bartonella alsatica TaxID=52764 RepID=J0PNZ2_9HYPH|nr:hypothetical protein [Bartonella alsatica]EJF74186.1 hypothetical protein MEC_01338 [Bartonella alsatica IBS 382]QLC51863.1 hypothetical protein HWV54_02870 [Bartonella alsatica]
MPALIKGKIFHEKIKNLSEILKAFAKKEAAMLNTATSLSHRQDIYPENL